MGQSRKASAKRPKGGGGRRPIAAARARADEDAGLSAGEPVDAAANGAGLADGSVGPIDETNNAVYGRLRLKAESALEKLIEAPGVPANVRASAVRTALELVGAIGARAKDQRDQEDADGTLDPERLSIDDIDREIDKLGRV
jgi:hypothetical protein